MLLNSTTLVNSRKNVQRRRVAEFLPSSLWAVVAFSSYLTCVVGTVPVLIAPVYGQAPSIFPPSSLPLELAPPTIAPAPGELRPVAPAVGSADAQPRVAAKPAVAAASSLSGAAGSLGGAAGSLGGSTGRVQDGATYVALASDLQTVFSGREPSSLTELRALELQQSKVAQAIERVTVNVQQGSAQGSGVIITADGYVLTAAHVAGGKDRDATVILNDGTQLRARTMGMNRDKDAGLLKIEDSRFGPWPYATIGRSSDLRVGQWCIASGHPGGWKPDRGAVIRVGRVLKISKSRSEKDAHTLFTDCALIGGDSGGPLFTLEGKLIGIHSRIGANVEDNMHVPVDVFASSWDRMVNREVWGMLPGYQPVIGVGGTQNDERPLISSLANDGPALKAGIEVGDLVLACDGVSIDTFAELRERVEESMPGDIIVLKVQRDGQILQIPVTVGVQD